MPELPDIQVYLHALDSRVVEQTLIRVRLRSPFLLRSVSPPLAAVHGKRVLGLRRLGKRLVFCLQDDLFLVLHLMIAGRLRWRGGASSMRRTSPTIVPAVRRAAGSWPIGCSRDCSKTTGHSVWRIWRSSRCRATRSII